MEITHNFCGSCLYHEVRMSGHWVRLHRFHLSREYRLRSRGCINRFNRMKQTAYSRMDEFHIDDLYHLDRLGNKGCLAWNCVQYWSVVLQHNY